jgi:hypothetical protein
MKTGLAFAITLGLGATAAHAVMINPRGTGQVLLYPYYTTNVGQATLISVINATANGKALKLRFHEGYNGRDVLDMNLYLSPHDVWAAVVSAPNGDAGSAQLYSSDNSCTVPAFAPNANNPATTNPILFTSDNYTGANADGGPTTLERAHEGHIEIIEMGEVTNASHNSLTAISHVGGTPPGCAQLVSAWAADGYWTADATADIGPPTGGLYGEESIVSVDEGTMYGLNAIAIDNFRSQSANTGPQSASPDLDSAIEDGHSTVTAEVPVGGHTINATYASPIDAISALFMTDSLSNEYQLQTTIAASSDWFITQPTKRFYVTPATTNTPASTRAPFDPLFNVGDDAASCASVGLMIFNREESFVDFNLPFDPHLPPFPVCFETSYVGLGASSVLGSQLHLPPTNDALGWGHIDPPYSAGHLTLELTRGIGGGVVPTHVLTASSEGYVLHGMPALGFLAVQYVNGALQSGVLSNYNAAFYHRTHATCTMAADATQSCPTH